MDDGSGAKQAKQPGALERICSQLDVLIDGFGEAISQVGHAKTHAIGEDPPSTGVETLERAFEYNGMVKDIWDRLRTMETKLADLRDVARALEKL